MICRSSRDGNKKEAAELKPGGFDYSKKEEITPDM